ncbi:MAG: nucleotide-binding protein, partial [Methermicoccaceae archaeon]
QTAERIKRLSADIGVKKLAVVLNKVQQGTSSIEQRIAELGMPILGAIPLDERVAEADLVGVAPIELGGDAVDAIASLKDSLLKMLIPQD